MRRLAVVLAISSVTTFAGATPATEWRPGEPPPLGYHTVPRYGPIVTGVIVGSLGAATLGAGVYGMAKNGDRSFGGPLFAALGGLMVPVGVLLVGLGYDHPRLVRDERSWVPMVGLGRVGLVASF